MNINNDYKIVDDLKSGLIVALVAVPLCLGISLASGAPLIAGLISGILGGMVIGSISNSGVSVSGPAAGLAVIVYGSIQQLGAFDIFLCSVMLAGVLQIALGLFRAGKIAQYLPAAVIEGLLASIGIVIILKQVPYLLGFSNFAGYQSLVSAQGWQGMHAGVSLVGLCCLGIFIVYNSTRMKNFKVFKFFPLTLMLVVVASAAAAFMGEGSFALEKGHFVNLGKLGEGGSFLSIFQSPRFDMGQLYTIVKCGVVIAIIASIETLLCIEAGDKMDRFKRTTNTNRELVAQGIGNLISGMIGGLPLTSVIVRSSVNIQSGARSKLSTITHGSILLVSVALLPQLLTKIPLAVLAVILVISGYNLAHPRLMKKVVTQGLDQSLIFFGTIVGILATDLLLGVIIGCGISALVVMKNSYKIQEAEFKHYTDVGARKHVLTFGGHLNFMCKSKLRALLRGINGPCTVQLDFSKTVVMDQDIKELLHEFMEGAEQKGISLQVQEGAVETVPHKLAKAS